MQKVDRLINISWKVLSLSGSRNFVLKFLKLVNSTKSLFVLWNHMLARLYNATEVHQGSELERKFGLINSFDVFVHQM
jgi:hypothetical protein